MEKQELRKKIKDARDSKCKKAGKYLFRTQSEDIDMMKKFMRFVESTKNVSSFLGSKGMGGGYRYMMFDYLSNEDEEDWKELTKDFPDIDYHRFKFFSEGTHDKNKPKIHIPRKALDFLKERTLKSFEKLNIPQEMIDYLEEVNYFKQPASFGNHLNCEGGLMVHSWHVYHLFIEKLEKCGAKGRYHSALKCSLFHDLCKSEEYSKKKPDDLKNKHGGWSLEVVEKFINLLPEEKDWIRYHFGVWGLKEILPSMADYDLKEWYKSIVSRPSRDTLLFHYADNEASLIENEVQTLNRLEAKDKHCHRCDSEFVWDTSRGFICMLCFNTLERKHPMWSPY